MTMKKFFHFIVFPFFFYPGLTQVIISGKVMDEDSAGIAFANVYLKDIYDGDVTDENGYFSFTSDTTGNVVLITSIVGYKKKETMILLEKEAGRYTIVLEKDGGTLMPVTVTAGTFEASDKKRAVLLKPLDIVTTAGAGGDIYGALQTLPGVVANFAETGLFVRGGEAYETKTIIDGLIVPQPFLGDVPDIPARGRFSPFQFKGTIFSTGGYSAEYSQALSSVLLMNTQDVPEESSTNINLQASGVNIARTKKLDPDKVLIAEAGYTNLKYLFKLVQQNPDWIIPPRGHSVALGYRSMGKNRNMLKSVIRYQFNEMRLSFADINNPGTRKTLGNKNANLMINNSYSAKLGDRWDFYAGLSYNYDDKQRTIDPDMFSTNEHFIQAKTVVSKKFTNPSILLRSGTEIQWLKENFAAGSKSKIRDTYLAAFSEAEFQISKKFAYRAGIRVENSDILDQTKLSPRVSLAYKTGSKAQVSFAYGHFYQAPENVFLRETRSLSFQQAEHYIVNYQILSDDYSFRVEVYFKNYKKLVKNDLVVEYSNSGFGQAKGVDLFWRDKKSIKNFEYWVSYSWLKSNRLFRDYPSIATPPFAPEHTLNMAMKYELKNIRSRIGGTYMFSSGRTYINPNNPSFLSDKTPAYHNLSFNFSYLTSVFKNFTVIFVSLNNILGIQNTWGYRYSSDGLSRLAVIPSAYRSFFAGMFISIK